MKIEMYKDVHKHSPNSEMFVMASNKPNSPINGTRRFKFTVTIPDDAIFDKFEYAPCEDVKEID